MNQIKYIAIDIDGTLLDRNNEIQPKTKESLIEVQEKGIEVILASGRPVKGMIGIAKELQLHKYGGVVVSNNGAVAYDVKNDKLIFESPIDKDDVYEVLQYCEQNSLVPMIEKGDYMLVRDVFEGVVDTADYGKGRISIIEYEARNGNFLLKEIPNLKEYIDFNVNKILTIVEPEVLANNLERLSSPFKDRLYVAQTSPFFLEFMKKGINKAYGLEKLGINSNHVISFGDSLNDIEMIKFAKIGVAMGNAQEQVKKASNYITSDRDEEGIYNALKHFNII